MQTFKSLIFAFSIFCAACASRKFNDVSGEGGDSTLYASRGTGFSLCRMTCDYEKAGKKVKFEGEIFVPFPECGVAAVSKFTVTDLDTSKCTYKSMKRFTAPESRNPQLCSATHEPVKLDKESFLMDRSFVVDDASLEKAEKELVARAGGKAPPEISVLNSRIKEGKLDTIHVMEAHSISNYQKHTYDVMNEWLRKGKVNKKQVFGGLTSDQLLDQLKMAASGTAKLVDKHPYSGPLYRITNWPDKVRKANPPGTCFSDAAFLSTSVTQDVPGLSPFGNELFFIAAKAGAPVWHFQLDDQFDEKEVLFLPGTIFKMIATEQREYAGEMRDAFYIEQCPCN